MVDKDPYVTEEDATATFFSRRVNTYSWDNATQPERTKALKEATDRIDRLSFIGAKLDPDQDREFPRDFQTVVPLEIEQATCLIAYAILDGVDLEIEDRSLSVVTQSFSNTRTTYEPSVRRDYIRNGIPSAEAWQCLLPFLSDEKELNLCRV